VGEYESSEGFGRKDVIAFMSHQAACWNQGYAYFISVFGRQLTSVCLWIYDFQTDPRRIIRGEEGNHGPAHLGAAVLEELSS